MAGLRDTGFVEDFDAHGIAIVDQSGEADQGLFALLNFHQLGEFAEVPGGVALGGGGAVGWRGFGFCSLSRLRERVRVRVSRLQGTLTLPSPASGRG